MTIGLLNPKLGEHNVIDDIDGFKIRSDRTRKDWRGLISSKDNWSERHPQLTLRPRNEQISVVDARERPTDKFVTQVSASSLNQR